MFSVLDLLLSETVGSIYGLGFFEEKLFYLDLNSEISEAKF